MHGREALILPTLGRSERDIREGVAQFVSVEDSMRCVHRSQGRLEPASNTLMSEPAIVCAIARAALGAAHPFPWEDFGADYDRVRERIARVVPGCEDMNRRVRSGAGFVLPSGAGARAFKTGSGRAHFSVQPIPEHELPPGQLWLMTIRSHDQYNTTVYSNDDRYRGIAGDRRVVFLNRDDMTAQGLREGENVELTSHWRGGTRALTGFRVRAYDLPRGCAAAYFPEANPLVPLDACDAGSRTPAFKSLPVSLRSERGAAP